LPQLLRALLPDLLVHHTTQSVRIGSTEETPSEAEGLKLALQEHSASSLYLLKIYLIWCVVVD